MVVLTWLGARAGFGRIEYLPAFFVGAMIAVRLDVVRTITERINARWFRHPLWSLLTFGSALLMIAPWLFGPGVGGCSNWTRR